MHVRTDLLSSKLTGQYTDHTLYFLKPPGEEHYHLLATLAGQLHDATIVDIGTHYGYSALALSGNSNRVITFDINDQRRLTLPSTVEFRLVNILDDETAFPLDASLALLDIDPHSGREEQAVIQQLLRRGWKGTVICDDVRLNDGMRRFWRWASEQPGVRATDLTHVGHWSGTGSLELSGSTPAP